MDVRFRKTFENVANRLKLYWLNCSTGSSLSGTYIDDRWVSRVPSIIDHERLLSEAEINISIGQLFAK